LKSYPNGSNSSGGKRTVPSIHNIKYENQMQRNSDLYTIELAGGTTIELSGNTKVS
jgi:hypothetical protein